jgi:hypothetical protein
MKAPHYEGLSSFCFGSVPYRLFVDTNQRS